MANPAVGTLSIKNREDQLQGSMLNLATLKLVSGIKVLPGRNFNFSRPCANVKTRIKFAGEPFSDFTVLRNVNRQPG